MASNKEKRQVKQIAKLLHEEKNRSVHHNLAVYELRSIAQEYDDPLLKDAVERCISIIFNQDEQINQLKMDKIFNS